MVFSKSYNLAKLIIIFKKDFFLYFCDQIDSILYQ